MAIDSMDGVLGIRPYIPKSIKQANFRTRWKKQFYSTKPENLVAELNIFGLWAYDITWALAKAVEDIWPLHNPLYTKSPRNHTNPIANLGKSKEGPRLLNKMLNSKPIQGLSGEFHIVNGQLEPLALEIFNVIGNGERVLGFWTPKSGISRNLSSSKRQSASSVDNLRKIIWPGDSTVKPLGSGIQTLKKLKIGVPEKFGFPGLVQLELNQTTNETIYQGFCIDVFRAAVDALPASIKFDYELLYYPVNSTSSRSGYDELLYQIYNKTFDAVVGDTSIVANRWYVDFTLPYSDLGVAMVVPSAVTHMNSRDIFIFLKPFCWGLWLAVVVAFFSTLLAIGYLRWLQSDNAENGQWYHLYIPMAAIFAKGESELDNRSRCVLVVLFLGMSIVMGSYTASFNAIVKAESQNGKVDLNANGVYIGYQSGSSIVKDLLLNKLQIDESRIKSYTTLEQYDRALSQGSHKGGVSAIIDETPYLKLFLAKYGSKYKVDGPVYRTEGFAFAFPMGSPLVSQLSKAIVNISRSGEIEEIQQKYFTTDDSLSVVDQSDATYKLPFMSFLGLFVLKALLVILIFITLPQFRSCVRTSWSSLIGLMDKWPFKWPRSFRLQNQGTTTSIQQHGTKPPAP